MKECFFIFSLLVYNRDVPDHDFQPDLDTRFFEIFLSRSGYFYPDPDVFVRAFNHSPNVVTSTNSDPKCLLIYFIYLCKCTCSITTLFSITALFNITTHWLLSIDALMLCMGVVHISTIQQSLWWYFVSACHAHTGKNWYTHTHSAVNIQGRYRSWSHIVTTHYRFSYIHSTCFSLELIIIYVHVLVVWKMVRQLTMDSTSKVYTTDESHSKFTCFFQSERYLF